jgi:precorrin-3B C17-methyltransferase
MASLIYQLAQEYDPIEIEVVPGITAACSGAAVLVHRSFMILRSSV